MLLVCSAFQEGESMAVLQLGVALIHAHSLPAASWLSLAPSFPFLATKAASLKGADRRAHKLLAWMNCMYA